MMLIASPSDGEAIFSILKVACLVYVMILRHHQKCASRRRSLHNTNKWGYSDIFKEKVYIYRKIIDMGDLNLQAKTYFPAGSLGQ